MRLTIRSGCQLQHATAGIGHTGYDFEHEPRCKCERCRESPSIKRRLCLFHCEFLLHEISSASVAGLNGRQPHPPLQTQAERAPPRSLQRALIGIENGTTIICGSAALTPANRFSASSGAHFTNPTTLHPGNPLRTNGPRV
jgi:hypothetical protein